MLFDRPLRNCARTTAIVTATMLALAACAGEPDSDKAAADPADTAFPAQVTSCGHTSTVEVRPNRAITLNQGATEVVLALGLEDQLAATAYLDDAISPKWQAAYEQVEVLSAEYPTNDDLIAAEPDFVYASYVSAFGKDVAGSQAELEAHGTPSYLSPFGCEDPADRPAVSFDAVWDEIEAVATAFGEPERAADFRKEQGEVLADLATTAAGDGLDVLWYDSGEKSPLVGAGGSGPQLVLDAVGATNIFADVEGGWSESSWEEVVRADPDVIVLADASWSSAEEKIAYLENDPVLSQLTAVRNKSYAVVAYSESTPGVRLVDGAASLSEQIQDLDLDQ